jgi:di/tripeptidase
LIGDRPTGATPTGSTLVQSASAAARAFGLNSSYGFSSTDANTPISLRIPAIRINGGGSGGRNHSPEEWIDVEKTAMIRGMTIAMTTLLAMAGVR